MKKKNRDIIFVICLVMVCVFIVWLLNGNYRVLHVVTGSMEPCIETGSYIVVKKVNPSELKENDIITYISKEPQIYGKYNTHRIYDICTDTYTGEKLFITKGDAYDEPDEYPVERDEIVGKMVKILPIPKFISRVMAGLNQSSLFWLFVFVPLFICLISYFIQLFKLIFAKEEKE